MLIKNEQKLNNMIVLWKIYNWQQDAARLFIDKYWRVKSVRNSEIVRYRVAEKPAHRRGEGEVYKQYDDDRDKADADDIFNVEFTGSDESATIQKLRKSSYDLQKTALSNDVDLVEEKLELHRFLAQNIILENPRSAAAYYALNQTIYGYYYLDPYDKNDLKYWSAVATSYNLYYPDYQRSVLLRNQTLYAMSLKRDKSEQLQKILDAAVEQGFVDIALPNLVGDIVKLSSLIGNVVLVDFTSYALDFSPAHTLFLREMYDKYSSQGFTIYQVSIDLNHLLWVEKSREMPWISVRDNDPLNCKARVSYNVTELPTFFLMDRNGDIIGRFNHENLEKALLEIL